MKNLFNLIRPTLHIAAWITLCALMFTACSTKEEAKPDSDVSSDDLMIMEGDIAAGAVSSSPVYTSDTRARISADISGKVDAIPSEKLAMLPPPPIPRSSSDGDLLSVASPTVSMLSSGGSMASSESAGGFGGIGIRGGRSSETSIRRDGIAISDPVVSGKIAAPVTTAKISDRTVTTPTVSTVATTSTTFSTGDAASVEYSIDDFLPIDEPARATPPTEFETGPHTTIEFKAATDDIKALDKGEVLIKKLSTREEVEDIEIAPEPEPIERAGQLTAGEWSDLTEWNFWNSVIAAKDWSHMKEHWGFGKGERISVRVDNGSQPIADAEAKLYDKSGKLLWTARTDNYGAC